MPVPLRPKLNYNWIFHLASSDDDDVPYNNTQDNLVYCYKQRICQHLKTYCFDVFMSSTPPKRGLTGNL